MHPVRVAKVTMADAFDVLKRWVRHVHFHDGVTTDGKLVMVPVGEGDIDHKTAVELLERMGYDGYMSGEWINWQPYEEHLPRELATMKTYGKM
jgi:sugar phosphate isomerase/epimerase